MIEKLVKESVKGLKPYVPNDYEYKYKMDANESPFNASSEILEKILEKAKELNYNVYPDSDSVELRKKIAPYAGLSYKNIMVGNGSDELIHIIFNTFVDKGDIVFSHAPTFVMYSINATIAQAGYVEYETDENFEIDIDRFIEKAKGCSAKLVFLCNPNNPTGNQTKRADVVRALEALKYSIVVVDEAYVEFGGESVIDLVDKYENLIVLRTFSKAFGFAGIRTGYLAASGRVMENLEKVKPPYNLNIMSQAVAQIAVENICTMNQNVAAIKRGREALYERLSSIEGIDVYPSNANFIVIKSDISEKIFEGLLKRGIMVRKFSAGKMQGCIRITVGSKEQNDAVISSLEGILKGE